MIPSQSATSITDYKLCPTLFYLRHVLRLRPVDDPDAARMGTSWHKCLEILTMEPGSNCTDCQGCTGKKDCPICGGSGTVPEDIRMSLIAHLDQAYAICPPSVELTDWEIERIILFYSALGWQWYWQQFDDFETVAREVHFERQVNNLYSRRGIIDRIIHRDGQLCLGEYKSTGQPIDSGSVYWDVLKLATQPTFYILEARHAQLAGKFESFGITPGIAPLISGVLYDVWKKPTIRPKKLTQAESKKFLYSGPVADYYDENFEISGDEDTILVNGVDTPKIRGAKEGMFAIRETPAMFGARLLADIRERPERYFARKEIPRSDKELAQLDAEYENIARITHFMTQRNLWYRNEHQCTNRYRCSMHPICLYNLDVSNGQVPDGFKCLNKGKK